MPPGLLTTLAEYGPAVVILGVLAWQSPKALQVVLEHIRKEREARRKYERDMQKFLLDLEHKRTKLEQARERAPRRARPPR